MTMWKESLVINQKIIISWICSSPYSFTELYSDSQLIVYLSGKCFGSLSVLS